MIALIARNFKVWWILSLQSFISSGFLLFLYAYFVGKHVSFFAVVAAGAIANLFVVLYFIIRRRHDTVRTMRLGFILIAAAFLILFAPASPLFVLFPFVILSGLGSILFWVPNNIVYFSPQSDGKNYQRMTAYWAAMIVASVLGPLAGSLVFAYYGLVLFVITALALLTVMFFLVQFIPHISTRYTLRQIIESLKGLRLLMLIDGAIHKNSSLIALFSLVYIKKDIDFGFFLSAMSLVGLVAAFKIAKISDRLNRRTSFLWSLSFFAGLTVALMSLTHTFWPFFLLALLSSVLGVINDPLRSTIILDQGRTEPLAWIARELYLNIGRTILLAIVALFLYLDFARGVYLVLGFLYFLFPVVVYLKKIYAPAH